MILNRETLKSLQAVALEHPAGVAVLRPYDADVIVLAVTRVDLYDPSNNIHHTTVQGRDITLLIEQRLTVAGYSGPSPVGTFIERVTEEQTWRLTPAERWYWLNVQTVL